MHRDDPRMISYPDMLITQSNVCAEVIPPIDICTSSNASVETPECPLGYAICSLGTDVVFKLCFRIQA